MQMSLIILPEEQKCSPKEQVNQCLVQPTFQSLYKGAIVSESTREHKSHNLKPKFLNAKAAKIIKGYY